MEYQHAVLPDNNALKRTAMSTNASPCHRDNGDDFGRLDTRHPFQHAVITEKFSEGSSTARCDSCHDALRPTAKGLQLWENVKYEALGDSITTVENVEGNVQFATQDKVQGMDELYSYDFVHGYYDHMRYACSPQAALDLRASAEHDGRMGNHHRGQCAQSLYRKASLI